MSKDDISSLVLLYIFGVAILMAANLGWYVLFVHTVASSHQEWEYLMDWVGFIALLSTLLMAVFVTAIICFTTYKFRQLELNHKKEERRDEFMREYERKQEQQLRTTIR